MYWTIKVKYKWSLMVLEVILEGGGGIKPPNL